MESPRGKSFKLVRQMGHELVIVDEAHDAAHRLSPDAAAVWRACDGRTESVVIAARTGVAHDRVKELLVDLGERGLLELPGETRRSVLRKAAFVGVGIGAGLPAITSIVIPSAAEAFDSQTVGGPPHTSGPGASPTGAEAQGGVEAAQASGPPKGETAGRHAHGKHQHHGGGKRGAKDSGGGPGGGNVAGVTEAKQLRAGHGSLPFTGANLVREAAVGVALLAWGLAGRVTLRKDAPPVREP